MSVTINDDPSSLKPTPRDEFAEALKQAAITIGKKGLMQFLSKKILAWAAGKAYEKLVTSIWTIANPIVGFFLGWIVVYLVKETEFGIFFWYIDTRATKQGRDFVGAALVNQQVQQHGTDEEKKNAENHLRETFYNLASLRS